MASLAATDEEYMRRCLQLAARAEGHTAQNPLVGCVVLDKEGKVVAEALHQKRGESHAEVLALDIAGDAAAGGTLYCSLEPCCHHGLTPPCSDRVIKSGVRRVVSGMTDPNPKVAGGGHSALERAGIEVVSGVLEFECRYLNRGFIKAVTKGIPWLALKMAVTLDGKIADRQGGSRWITGPESRQYVMQLRSRFDAVMVGAGTVRTDDPSLTVRLDASLDLEADQGERIMANPVRVIIDPTLTLSPQAKVFTEDGQSGKTFVFHSGDDKLLTRLPAKYPEQARLVSVQSHEETGHQADRVKLDLRACLKSLKEAGINKVLCEGGAALAGSLLDDGLVDEIYWFIAPKILADAGSLPAVASSSQRLINEALNLKVCWSAEYLVPICSFTLLCKT